MSGTYPFQMFKSGKCNKAVVENAWPTAEEDCCKAFVIKIKYWAIQATAVLQPVQPKWFERFCPS